MIKPWIALIILLGGLSTHSLFASPLSTTLEIRFEGSSTQLRFAEPIRLDQAVMQTLEHYQLSTLDIDWLSAGLFDLSHPYSFKQHVLLVMAHQQSSAPIQQKALWEKMRSQLRLSAFAKRVFAPIDPDWTRIAPQDNPRLNGQWLLTLNPRVGEVSVYGAVHKPGDVTWRSRQTAKDYAQAAGLIDEKIAEIVVIQPDGVVQVHSVAYWNMNFAEVAPGAIVYVPIPLHDSSFYPNTPNTDANQLVIELLRNRLPL
ncbi:capsule biosynthesis GfcC family protein [Vibrio mimicus]|uniref:capsule biosynthesis GfcC family protein n=1 Tax=Vibrio mimicus TaxID=674 RepID=UPI002F957976